MKVGIYPMFLAIIDVLLGFILSHSRMRQVVSLNDLRFCKPVVFDLSVFPILCYNMVSSGGP